MSLDVYLETPNECPNCGHKLGESANLFTANITHNLNRMAEAAGLYKALWRPGEIGIVVASQLIEPLRTGIAHMESDPDCYRVFNPSNGWGSYDTFVPWLKKYLAACEEHPSARVKVWG